MSEQIIPSPYLFNTLQERMKRLKFLIFFFLTDNAVKSSRATVVPSVDPSSVNSYRLPLTSHGKPATEPKQ